MSGEHKCVECGTASVTSTCPECGGIVSGITISVFDLGVGGVHIMVDECRKLVAERDALRAEVERLRAEVERLRAKERKP